MTPTTAFLRYELRRHLPGALATGASLFAPSFLLHRWIEGSWAFWDDDWHTASARVLLYFGVPAVGLALALSGWASERGEGSASWLWARPLSARRHFATRVLAIGLGVLAFGAVTVVLHGAATHAGWRGGHLALDPVWALHALFLAAAGLLASALAERAERAFFAALLVLAPLYVVRGLVAGPLGFGVWRPVAWRPELLVVAEATALGLAVVGCLLAAWAAVRKAPLDPGRVRRAVRAGVGPLIAALLVVAGLAVRPWSVGEAQVAVVRSLGDGVRLELFRTEAMAPTLLVARLAAGESPVGTIRRPLSTSAVYPHPDSGRAVVPTAEPGTMPEEWGRGSWLLVERGGTAGAFSFPGRLAGRLSRLIPVGWSPSGERFAWVEPARHEVMVGGEDRQVEGLRVSVTPRSDVVWVDDDRLLFTHALTERERAAGEPAGWRMVEVVGWGGRSVRSVPPGPVQEVRFAHRARFRGLPVAAVGSPEGSWMIAALDADAWRFSPLAAAGSQPPEGPGVLGDGRAVWIERPSGTGRQGFEPAVVVSSDGDGEPSELCRTGHLAASPRSFVAEVDGWLVWRPHAGRGRWREGGWPGLGLFACEAQSGRVAFLSLEPRRLAILDEAGDGRLSAALEQAAGSTAP